MRGACDAQEILDHSIKKDTYKTANRESDAIRKYTNTMTQLRAGVHDYVKTINSCKSAKTRRLWENVRKLR
jgi:hypothetical protein